MRSDLMDLYPALADFRVEGGASWIDVAQPWQVDDLAAMLAVDGPSYHWLSRPRGASKSGDAAIAAMLIMMCQVDEMSLCYAVAADKDQACLVTKRVQSYVAQSPPRSALREWHALLSVATAPNGSRLETLAAHPSSGWGLTTPLILCDELGNWGSVVGGKSSTAVSMWNTIWSTVVKVDGCRLVVMTTKGVRRHWTEQLRAEAKLSQMWRYSEVTGPVPWESSDALAEQRRFLVGGGGNGTAEELAARLHDNADPDSSDPWAGIAGRRAESRASDLRRGSDLPSVAALRW